VAGVELRVVELAVLSKFLNDRMTTSVVRVVDKGELRFDAAFQELSTRGV
jgi:hypothetical protein